jgi:hypothetical protein
MHSCEMHADHTSNYIKQCLTLKEITSMLELVKAEISHFE